MDISQENGLEVDVEGDDDGRTAQGSGGTVFGALSAAREHAEDADKQDAAGTGFLTNQLFFIFGERRQVFFS
jgi:hypothetical protein